MKLERKAITKSSIGEIKKFAREAMGNLGKALSRQNGHEQTYL